MSKYTEAADKKKDKAMVKKAGLDKKEKAEFAKKDKKHKKPKSLEDDRAMDKDIISKIKKKRKKK